MKGPFVGFFYSLLKSPCPRGLIRGGRLICKNDFLGGAYSRRGEAYSSVGLIRGLTVNTTLYPSVCRRSILAF